MSEVIDVEKYRGTTAGEIAETLQRFGFTFRPSNKREEMLIAVHEETGHRVPVHVDPSMPVIASSVYGYGEELELAEIADRAAFDAVLAEVKKQRAHS